VSQKDHIKVRQQGDVRQLQVIRAWGESIREEADKLWKQHRCPTTDEQIKKMWYRHIQCS
jgi:hypothetical protein